MSLKWAAIGIAIVGLGMAGYGIWQQIMYPQRTLSVGTIELPDPRRRDQRPIRLVTRTVAIGSTVRTEVELPHGTWIDCSGDCPAAARKATFDFWKEQKKK
jgi:hypothetical protein